ncbi:class I adenylate-forming enzyme family protein [Ilumatobacter sp.]|uniref:class I adenylate-forming enzyme family protein n=1 Tax=Ilumatobacter sp. TaxID=1967498 RepID=UPI0037515CCE
MNLGALLHIAHLLVPDHPAAIDHANSLGDYRTTTYAELWNEAAVLAGHLAGRELPPGTRIGVLGTNSSRIVSAIFGVAAAGHVSVPLNFRATSDELAHLLSDADPALVLAETRYVDVLSAVAAPGLEIIPLDVDFSDYRAALGNPDPAQEIADVDDSAVAVLLYTSGTSSKPKGVKITHGSLTRYAMETNDGPDGTNTDVMLVSAPLSHVAALTSVSNSLYTGRTLVLIPQFDVDLWLDAVEAHSATHSFLVPTMLHRLIEAPRITAANLSSLRVLTYGAAPMPPTVIRRAIELLPHDIDFVGAYGQTETTSTVAVLDADDHRMEGSDEEITRKWERLGSVGRILPDVKIRIVDRLGGDLPASEVGEVLLHTYRTMVGYWGSAGSSRITVDGDGWVHTGDLGRLDADGYLYLHGRRGDMIIRGGENVVPEEIEHVLMRHKSVLDAGVVGVQDEDFGEAIFAAVVLRPNVDVEPEELTALLEQHMRSLPSYKRPTEYLFVSELPRTATGKLLRRTLPHLRARSIE